MRETNASITEYVQSYNTVWDELMKDEAHLDLALREYGHGSVYTTWNISFESVKRKNEDAAKFLQLWSYLGNGDIWYELFNNKQNPDLHKWSAPPEWFKRVVGGKTGFRKAVRVLLAYSLVEAKEDFDAFAMHPVVHEWCRNTMDADQRQEMAFLAITTVGFAVPSQMDFGDWRLQLRLLPHASQWLQRLKSAEDKTLCEGDWFALDRAIYNLGILHYHQTKFAEAERLFQRVLDSRDRNPQPELGESDLTTDVCYLLGQIYLTLGKLVAAEAIFKRAQKGIEVFSGPDDLGWIKMTRRLGEVYREQEKLAKAESTMQQALSASMRTVGPEHDITLHCIHDIALGYMDQGNLIKAEKMFKQALAGYESALGPDHFSTLRTVRSLSYIYRKQGKIAEAEASNQRAILGFEKLLGPHHLWTSDAIFEQGILHKCQNRLEDAEAAFRRVLAGYQNALGPENKSTLSAYRNLGYVLYRQGKLVEAGPIFEQFLSGSKKTFGADHQWTKDAANDLSKVYEEQGRLAEAEAILQSIS
jgi:tetratricopeptide (TPR) repeat protein